MGFICLWAHHSMTRFLLPTPHFMHAPTHCLLPFLTSCIPPPTAAPHLQSEKSWSMTLVSWLARWAASALRLGLTPSLHPPLPPLKGMTRGPGCHQSLRHTWPRARPGCRP